MGALLALLPTILRLLDNPAIAALLAQLAGTMFQGVDPNKAGQAVSTVLDPEAVKWIQMGFNLIYPDNHIEADGKYGQATKDIARKYQETNKLVVDGWVGPITAEVMRKEIAAKYAVKKEV